MCTRRLGVTPVERLLCRVVSLVLLGWTASGVAQQAPVTADSAASSPEELHEVIVTGTRIRGVAPVGSTVVQFNQEDLGKQGLASVADALNTVPFVLKMGAGTDWSGGNNSSSVLNAQAFNKSPNLRGMGVQATLSLVNGRRVPYEGGNMNAFDGDNLPSQLLKSVEIVADGTSPIYGADAVAGTVNYVTRDPFNGIEAYGQYGHADGQDSWQTTLIGGLKWDTGGFIASYQHTHYDPLRASSRPGLYSDDYSPYGGPSSPIYSSPGNLIVDGVPYAIPHGQAGSALTLAQLGPAGQPNTQNSWTGYDALPGSGRNIGTLNVTQKATDWLELFFDGFFSRRDYAIAGIDAGTQTSVTLPNDNFYSPCNRSRVGAPAALVAACGTGSLTVDYNTVFDAGPATHGGYATSWDGAFGGRLSLPADWSATIEASRGTHYEFSDVSYVFGNGLPGLASLAGTSSSTAYNVFCDGTSFTCNSPAMAAAIPGVPWLVETQFDMRDYTVNLDGPVLTLPGGKLRVAVGGERFDGRLTNTNNSGSSKEDRTVNAGYVELYIPLFGEGNAVPGIRRLEIDAAGRIDSYSDVGSTTNPKVGINWTPFKGLQFHGSFGTSFRAPSLADNDPLAQHGYQSPSFPGGSITPSLCPTCATLGNLVAYQALGGANHDLKPETSRSYSLGLDWAPQWLKGLSFAANYWWLDYTQQVGYPVYNAGPFGAINQQYYNNHIIYNPALFPGLAANNPQAFFGNFPNINTSNADCSAAYGKRVTTQALFNNLLNCINAFGDGGLYGPPGTPANTAAIEDGHRINGGVTKAQGLDLTAAYIFDTDMGTWRVGASGEYIFRWAVAPITGAPDPNVVNTFTYPLHFRGRAELGWSRALAVGSFGAHLFVNYDNAYRMDPTYLVGGVPLSYTGISSYTTVDMTLTYDVGQALSWKAAHEFTVQLSVQNLFDSDPPLAINSAGVGGIRFDNLVAGPLKRVIQLQVGKKF